MKSILVFAMIVVATAVAQLQPCDPDQTFEWKFDLIPEYPKKTIEDGQTVTTYGWEITTLVESDTYDCPGDGCRALSYFALEIGCWLDHQDAEYSIARWGYSESSNVDDAFWTDGTSGLQVGPIRIRVKTADGEEIRIIYGVKWDTPGPEPGHSLYFYLVLYGDWIGDGESNDQCTEETAVWVKGSTRCADYATMGPSMCHCEPPPPPCDPCEPLYSISGIACLDVHEDGECGPEDPPLKGVCVDLRYTGASTILRTTKTDADGFYIFSSLPAGGYTVEVDMDCGVLGTPAGETYLYPTGAVFHDVTIGPDSENNNFPFFLDETKITGEGNGKTIGYWKHQLTLAMIRPDKAKENIDDLLEWIRTFAFPDPFQGSGEGGLLTYQEAFDILAMSSSDELDLLAKQLLGLEFNAASGKGMTDLEAQELFLMAWESVLAYPAGWTREEILAIKDLCDLINNSGN